MRRKVPKEKKYDVIIIGGAIMGSASAYFLSKNSDYNGKTLVIDKDLTFEFSSTARTNSCIRQQFSEPINVKISQFSASFISRLNKDYFKFGLPTQINLDNFGYLYLANTKKAADVLYANQLMQNSLGSGTYLLGKREASKVFPFMNFSDILLCSHNTKDEGYFDGQLLFEFFKNYAVSHGVEYIQDEVVDVILEGGIVKKVILKDGESISCENLVNCAGTNAKGISKMVNCDLPVEARKRFSFVFDSEEKLDKKVPLTIDPSGIHFRSDGERFLAGCGPSEDFPVDRSDFSIEENIWEDKVWPVLANRISIFDRIKLVNWWVGHYAFNTFDQNAIIGSHPGIKNFFFLNGFSGHGLQQSPAMGRGISELIIYNEFRTLDLSTLEFERIRKNERVLEKSII